MKRFQSLCLRAAFGFFVMGLLPAAGASLNGPAATQITNNVPHDAPGHGAHNVVMLGIASYDTQKNTVWVTINGNNPPVPASFPVVVGGQPAVVTINGGSGGAGAFSGTLSAIQYGKAIVVTYSGSITGWYGYSFQPSLTFPSANPLIVGVIPTE